MKGVFIDIETTGLDPFKHVPIDISCVIAELHDIKIYDEPYKMSELSTYTTLIKCSKTDFDEMHNESLNVHKITFEKMITGKPIDEVSEDLTELFLTHEIERDNSVFICQNPSFDRPFFTKILDAESQKELNLPYHWLDLASMYWARLIKKRKGLNVSLSKDSIAKSLNIPTEIKPHSSLQGVLHLIECYKEVSRQLWVEQPPSGLPWAWMI